MHRRCADDLLPIALIVGYRPTRGAEAIVPRWVRHSAHSAPSSTRSPTTVSGSLAVQLMMGCGAWHLREALTRSCSLTSCMAPGVTTWLRVVATLQASVLGERSCRRRNRRSFWLFAGFATLGIAALAALTAFFFGMPETARSYERPAPIRPAMKERVARRRSRCLAKARDRVRNPVGQVC